MGAGEMFFERMDYGIIPAEGVPYDESETIVFITGLPRIALSENDDSRDLCVSYHLSLRVP